MTFGAERGLASGCLWEVQPLSAARIGWRAVVHLAPHRQLLGVVKGLEQARKRGSRMRPWVVLRVQKLGKAWGKAPS